MISIALLLFSSTIYAVSIDCPNMIELARGLGMQTARPAIWTALQSDCCTASSIACDGSLRVTQISWNIMGLNGVINGTAIPSSVTHLELYFNAITGAIPNALPSGLTRLWLYNNAITGSIPDVLPSGLTNFYLHGNQMSGDLPSFPSTIQYLGLGYPGYPGNHFTGTLRLNRPLQLLINDNWITDVVIQNSSQIDPSWCDLSNNPLLGNPNIVGLTMCTKTGLYNAALLPVTRSTTKLTSVVTTVSVFGSTTQIASPEMTTTTQLVFSEMTTMAKTTTTSAVTSATLEGATTMEMTTNNGRNTAQQMSSSEMASGRMLLSIMMSVTKTLASSMATVQFVQEMSGIVVNLGIMLRCVVSTMILSVVFGKTPFTREFKRMRSKRTTTTTTSGLDF